MADRTSAQQAQDTTGLSERVSIPRPSIHTGPKHLTVDEATVSYLREAATRVRDNRYWGSGVSALVADVLTSVADTLLTPTDAPRDEPGLAERDLPRLLTVPDEESMYGLLVALNYGANPEVACVDGGRAFISTLTDPDADHVNYVYTDESGHSRCVVGCENCGSEGNQRADWKPRYPVTAILSQMPHLDRAAEDEIEEAEWLRAILDDSTERRQA